MGSRTVENRTKPPFSEGDLVKVLAPDTHKGDIVGVLEVDVEGEMVRTEFGWLLYDQVEAAPKAKRMTVDGNDSQVVLNGKTGGVAAKDPHQQALIEVPMEQLLHDFNGLAKLRDLAASQAGYWRGEVKLLNERIEPILAELRRRDDEKNGVEPSLFTAPSDDGGEEE